MTELTDAQRANVEFALRQAMPAATRVLLIYQINEPPHGYIIVYREEGDTRCCSLSTGGRVRWDRSCSTRAPLSV